MSREPFLSIQNCSLSFPSLVNAQSLKKKLLLALFGRSNQLPPSVQHLVGPINVDIKNGERVAILGPNGAGKSSLLRLMTKVYHPTYGVIATSGSINSMIDIHAGVKDELSGRDNARMLLKFFQPQNGEQTSSTTQILEEIKHFSGLEEAFEKPVSTYSSGMRLRLVFSTVTTQNSDILVMDEWMSVGDHEFVSKVNDRLHSLVEKSQIFVLATHSSEAALSLCERGIVMKKGEIIFDGPIADACNFYFN